MKKVPLWAMAGAFSIIIYLVPFLGFFPAWHRLQHIVHDGRTTIGTVLQKEPQNHESVRFEYLVNNVKYLGNAAAGRGGLPSFEAIRVGDAIPVTYWRERPSEAVGGNPLDIYKTTSFFLFVLVPCVCLFLGIIAAMGVRKRATLLWPDVIDWLVRRKTASR